MTMEPDDRLMTEKEKAEEEATRLEDETFVEEEVVGKAKVENSALREAVEEAVGEDRKVLTRETAEEAFNQQGPKVVQTAEEVQLERDLLEELASWEADQIDPNQVGMNTLRVISRLAAIEQVLIDNDLTTQKDLDRLLNEHLLKEMKKAHEAFRPMIEARRRAQLGLSEAPSLILPNGEQVKLQ